MNSRLATVSLLASAFLLPNLVVSCASDDPGNYELQKKLRDRNARYENSIERRTMRRQARDERYDAWFDMIMQ